ncbi:MAG: YfiR family protein [Flavobacteriales bacterium]|nr:YfiR family protein [Flavobacteriales bacterium]
MEINLNWIKQNSAHFLSAMLLCVALSSISKNTTAQSYTEREIKAAFICNFAKFVEWPSSRFATDTSAIIIGILGPDPFGPVIERIANNANVGFRKVRVVHYERSKEALDAHIVYLGGLTSPYSISQGVQPFAYKNVLTIGEAKGFCQKGGIINFTGEDVKYGFEINAKAAQRSGLKISAKLLKLAKIVE